jgi:hypothetical protein
MTSRRGADLAGRAIMNATMKRIALTSLLFVTACASADPPAVRSAKSAEPQSNSPPAAGMARVVFVRPESSCDTGTYPIIVDENGHFVAQIAQNSRAFVDFTAGAHTLYAWPSIDPRSDENNPDTDPVAVERVRLAPGTTRYIEIRIPRRSTMRCPRFTFFALEKMDDDDEDLQVSLKETRPITADRAAGETALDPALVQAHMENGRRRAERLQGERREQLAAGADPSAVKNSMDTK